MDMARIKEVAFDNLANKSSHDFKERGNKYYHGERVATLALKLRKIILPTDNSHDEIIAAAAWFHDIMNGFDDHAKKGATKTRELLQAYCSNNELNEICDIIAVHDNRAPGQEIYSDYINLHQDADHLDHFGTFDVWMSFIYAISHDQTMQDVKDWLANVRPTENDRYRSELNFDVSKKIFDEKMKFLKYFSDRFSVESSGGIWNESRFAI